MFWYWNQNDYWTNLKALIVIIVDLQLLWHELETNAK